MYVILQTYNGHNLDVVNKFHLHYRVTHLNYYTLKHNRQYLEVLIQSKLV